MAIADTMEGMGGTESAAMGAGLVATGLATGGTAPLVMGGIQIASGILGGYFAGKDRERAEKAFAEAEELINQTGAPPETAREIILEKFRAVGLRTPEVENAIDVGFSKMAQYQEDSKLREAGVNALQRMMKQAEGGLTAQDRLALRQVEQENQRAVQGKIAQIQQEQQMRGMGGAGAGLAAQLSAAQAGAERGLTSGLQIGSAASERALQALSMGSGQAEALRRSDLGLAQATRGAEDEFQRFRAQEAIGRQQRNVAARNRAGESYDERLQSSMDKNTAATNFERTRQREAEGTDWDRNFRLQSTKADLAIGKGGRARADAGSTSQTWGDIGKGGSDIYGSFATPTVKYDTRTGEALYDPVTGKRYT